MTNDTERSREGHEPWLESDDSRSRYSLRGRHILLAADHSLAAGAAAHVCAELEVRCGAQPSVLNVESSFHQATAPPLTTMVQVADELLGGGAHEPRLRELYRHLASRIGHVPAWPARVEIGSVASCVTREAQRLEAALIVMGLRQHDGRTLPFRDRTALTVMQHAAQPVLGVTPATAGAPRRIVVGVGFGDASIAAARASMSLLDGDGSLLLTFVQQDVDFVGEDETGHRIIHELGVSAAFSRLRQLLEPPAGVTIESVTRRGRPATELREAAIASAADAIAVGARRHGRVERWMLGSVTADLARDGRHSLIVVPPER